MAKQVNGKPKVGMSCSPPFRKLKALINQSPNQEIREMRQRRSKELLEKGTGHAVEAAYMLGFNSATYCTKCFGDYFWGEPRGAAASWGFLSNTISVDA